MRRPRRSVLVLAGLAMAAALLPAPARAESSSVRSFSRLALDGTTIRVANHEDVTLSDDSHLRLAAVSAPTDPCKLQVAFRHVTAIGASSGEGYQITGVDHFQPTDPCRDLGTLVRTTTVFQLLPPNPVAPPNPVIPSPPPIRLSHLHVHVQRGHR